MLSFSESPGLYGTHLARVSRSFAFCIEQLEEPLRQRVGLGYILCRLADTIEDSAWPTADAQANAFRRMRELLETPAPATEIRAWADAFPAEIPEGERLLLADAPVFIADLHSSPDEVRALLQRTVGSMIDGMAHFCGTDARGGRSRAADRIAPASLAEANQYCFFVAGIVGELLTDLVAITFPAFVPDERVYADAFHFGLYLQKINLLKDQLGDERVGRRLVPSRAQMRASLITHAERSLRYIQSIPAECLGYRIFCAWSFFLGLFSLPSIDQSWRERREVRVPRAQTMLYLARVRLAAGNDAALGELFEERRADLGGENARADAVAGSAELPEYADWFSPLYRGKLRADQLEDLGLFRAPAIRTALGRAP